MHFLRTFAVGLAACVLAAPAQAAITSVAWGGVDKKGVDLSDLTRVSEMLRGRSLYVVSAKQMPLDESGKVSHPLADDQLELFAEWYHDAMTASKE